MNYGFVVVKKGFRVYLGVIDFVVELRGFWK
jgi:hypothetical protein